MEAGMNYTIGSLFSGIGGIDLAFQQAGFQIIYQVEIDDYCQKVLTQHWPTVPKYRDIFTVDADALPATDVIAGGFPCQPFSVAGNQRGEADERFLWPEILRLVRAKRPRVVFLENVPGLRTIDSGRTFKRILRELAEIGYDAQWHHLRASDVGAPHRRERLFIVAYSQYNGHTTASQSRSYAETIYNSTQGTQSTGKLTGSDTSRIVPRQTMGNTPRDQMEGQRTGGQQESGGYECENVSVGAGQTVAYSQNCGVDRGQWLQRDDAIGGSGDGQCDRIRSNGGDEINQRFNPDYRQVESRLGRGVDGLSNRLDGHRFPAPPGSQYDWEPARTTTQTENRAARIKGLGNAVCPQVVFPIALAIKEYLEG